MKDNPNVALAAGDAGASPTSPKGPRRYMGYT